MAKPERILVFDADGVLIEPWGFADQLRTAFGISREQTHAFFAGPFHSCLLGTAELVDVLPPFLKEWGWSSSVQAFVDLWLSADDRPSEMALAALSAIRTDTDLVCLASNQERIRASYVSEQMGFGKVFDKLYFSCHLGVAKPMPEFFGSILNDLESAPAEIHFWDDSREHVDAARRLGWNAHLYTGPDSILRTASQGRDH